MPIDEFVDDALRSDLLPSLIAQGTFRGRLYALGAFESALVVYFNRNVVERAGITPPERFAEAWTWDEFVEALVRVRPHTALPLSLHLDDPSDEWITYAFSPLIWSHGGRLIDVDAERCEGILNGKPHGRGDHPLAKAVHRRPGGSPFDQPGPVQRRLGSVRLERTLDAARLRADGGTALRRDAAAADEWPTNLRFGKLVLGHIPGVRRPIRGLDGDPLAS